MASNAAAGCRTLQNDPIIVRLLGEHEPFRRLHQSAVRDPARRKRRHRGAGIGGAVLRGDRRRHRQPAGRRHRRRHAARGADPAHPAHAQPAGTDALIAGSPVGYPRWIADRLVSHEGEPMQILAEAEDLPKTANIKTQLISLWTVPVFGAVLSGRLCRVPGLLPADVARHDGRSGRGVLPRQQRR